MQSKNQFSKPTIIFAILAFILSVMGCHNTNRSLVEVQPVPTNYRTAFSYAELPGLEPRQGVTRRDPSDVIWHDGRYYFWYTKTSHGYSGYNASIWYAVSEDGKVWQEVAEALPRGRAGAWDSYSVFTPNILKANNAFYLFYTGVKPTPGNATGVFENNDSTDETAIGVAVADEPYQVFRRFRETPVLTVGNDVEDFDSYRVDDAALVPRDGGYWLYYKGRSRQYGNDGPRFTRMGVAFSEQPEGPYRKHSGNPLTNGGHEVMVWPYRGGVMTLLSTHGEEGKSLQYAEDGLEFEIVGRFGDDYPKAPGAFREDDFADPPLQDGLRWGISMHYGDSEVWPHLLRFEMALSESDELTEFADDVAFLRQHTDAVVLQAPDSNARIVVVPEMQGRVMTSTATGEAGKSFGWINRRLIAAHQPQAHINAYGGEDRFWLGPEGGQFSLFFAPGHPFDLQHWQTPAIIDLDAYPVTSQNRHSISFEKSGRLGNYSGTEFVFDIHRTVEVLGKQQIDRFLGIDLPSAIDYVGFQSINTLSNRGTMPWNKESGLLSIWILGMFLPSPQTTVVVPVRRAENGASIVNDVYFGRQPADRLRRVGDTVYFKGDGNHRGKIGILPQYAKDVLGAYDAANRVLTIVQYNQPTGVNDYVNSLWEIQQQPYAGDVINAYNDGAPEPGVAPLGPFFELETSSQAAALVPGESIRHTHRTFHFSGDETALGAVARATLGVSINDIADAFSAN